MGRTGKLYFNENEAARILGITVDKFRTLLKMHILDKAEDVSNSSQTTYHKSDLLILQLLASQHLARPGAEVQ
ncbi:MAG: hypothetical protein FJW39_24125 [Acidobacteria bacterium]|nr:hypothetical protein [Acidobacteriota bacterium]